MPGKENIGEFAWYTLLTPDEERSKAFYTELFGWQLRKTEIGGKSYDIFYKGEQPIGGLRRYEQPGRLTACWLPYIQVNEVERSVQLARTKGGEVVHEPTQVPAWGRYALLRDPGGALFGCLTWQRPEGKPSSKALPGTFCWHELLVEDTEEAKGFYYDLCRWTTVAEEEPGGSYVMFRSANRNVAGLLELEKTGATPPHWLCYIAVENVDETARRAVQMGAKLCNEPQDVAGKGRYAVLADPLGCPFALWQPYV